VHERDSTELQIFRSPAADDIFSFRLVAYVLAWMARSSSMLDLPLRKSTGSERATPKHLKSSLFALSSGRLIMLWVILKSEGDQRLTSRWRKHL
jgi:hypothetical protein